MTKKARLKKKKAQSPLTRYAPMPGTLGFLYRGEDMSQGTDKPSKKKPPVKPKRAEKNKRRGKK